MTLETPAEPQNEDLDRADRLDKWRTAVWVLALLLVATIAWLLISSNSKNEEKALSEASQKFTLAQQVAAACAIKKQSDDLGGLCASAKQIVKEGPTGPQGSPGDIGPQGPFGPKGEQGTQGLQGIQGIFGTQGKPGAKGLDGASGVAGPPGPQGDAGPQGEPGVAGPAGSNGADGVPGAAGVAGPAGATGATGQSAFPFTFTFTFNAITFACTLTAPDVVAACVAN